MSQRIPLQADSPESLKAWIKQQALDLGFADCVVADPFKTIDMRHHQAFLDKGYHGDMAFLAENLDKRANPTLLVPNTRSILCVRMNYLVEKPQPRHVPEQPNSAIIARYARGRDYHKVMRGRLKTLAQRIRERVGDFESRPFADSAPICERTLAERAGMGWTGKHTLLIQKKSGSFFVLGELFTSLELPFDEPVTAHCGSCSACMQICPTQAIVEPYVLDARRCISYLTIEFKGVIADATLRRGMGNRIFGCDDCQLICPWNRFATLTPIDDFNPRHQLDDISLLQIWQWDEAIFLACTEGSPIRRTGYQSFKRNIAIALGNAPYDAAIIAALQQAKAVHDDVVNTHIDWAIEEQMHKAKIG
ncbi:MAG: tRNA epoxyqueuosine(34) reductase QueG [Acinetobacter sp.]|nr:tRNA epoxyqueuosine(34) reductase QueG [Acinetobacter sp.]